MAMPIICTYLLFRKSPFPDILLIPCNLGLMGLNQGPSNFIILRQTGNSIKKRHPYTHQQVYFNNCVHFTIASIINGSSYLRERTLSQPSSPNSRRRPTAWQTPG
jgi:hypothetical protein